MLAELGVKSVKLPPPLAECECAGREIRTKHQGLLFGTYDLFGESSLRKGICDLVTHYHCERNHYGLGNRLIVPDELHADNYGAIPPSERLGAMLSY